VRAYPLLALQKTKYRPSLTEPLTQRSPALDM